MNNPKIKMVNGNDLKNCANEIEMNEVFGTINDNDFGDVDVYWYKDLHTIKADNLVIFNVPDNFSSEKINLGWEFYKSVYSDYGIVSIDYDEIDMYKVA